MSWILKYCVCVSVLRLCWGYAELLEKVMRVRALSGSEELSSVAPCGIEARRGLTAGPAKVSSIHLFPYSSHLSHSKLHHLQHHSETHTLVLNLSGSQSFSSCLHCRSADTLKTCTITQDTEDRVTLSKRRGVTIIRWVKKNNWKLLVLWSEADKYKTNTMVKIVITVSCCFYYCKIMINWLTP